LPRGQVTSDIDLSVEDIVERIKEQQARFTAKVGFRLL
jgi:hypothetical protein